VTKPQPPEPSSPAWNPNTRLAVGILLLVLILLLLSRLQPLFVPVLLAALLTYVLHPAVNWLNRRMPRGLAVLVVYLLVIVVAAGTSTGLGLAVSQQVVGLVDDLSTWSSEIPAALERLSEVRFSLGPWMIDLGGINLEPALTSLASSIRPLISGAGGLLASVAGATASAFGIALAVMVLGYYMLLDSRTPEASLLDLVPAAYQADVQRLLNETAGVWNAFLRGQLLLAAVIGILVAVVLTILGVRFSLVLGLIAGLLEFVPIFGPVVAGLVAVLVALFQGGNWWGLSPLAYGLVVLVVFVVIQQLENNVLVPRIIGGTLNLSPVLVLLGALAGGTLAGILGLLLAAPALATLRLWVGYIYRKVVGLETWPRPALLPRRKPEKSRLWQRIRRSLAGRRAGRPRQGGGGS